ncbi:MAG: aminotransferase class V-fold PLP-dependent enzyme [Woeseiaceae bacterium]|nr:aminotransferase class V-fold PLP-dependent enzyme [Woeseiaceae bacterium]
MSEPSIYLDYAATTPVDPGVADALSQALCDETTLANPSSVHRAGRLSAHRVATAAEQVASLLNCDPGQLIWTSGATEADNLAIAGAARYRADRGRHLVTMPTEHKAVTDMFRALEKEGFNVTWLAPGPDGMLDIGHLEQALTDETQLVSVMHVNNETSVVQDIEAIGELCRSRDILYHVDAAQSAGKLPIDLRRMPIDLLSLTAHKFYGPKGVGALYVADRPGCHVEPLLFGGGQQRSIRPGTLPVPLIVALGQAAEIAEQKQASDLAHVTRLRAALWDGIEGVEGLVLNGHSSRHYPGIVNVSVADVDGESLLLDLEPLCVATGSACNSQNQEPSYVLRSMGRSDAEAEGAIRFSFGRMSTLEDVEQAAGLYVNAVSRLRQLAPAA